MYDVRAKENTRMRPWWWGAIVLVTDQVSKWYIPVVVSNRGSVFGVGAGWAWDVISATVLCVLGWLLMRSHKAGERVGLSLIVAGGLSNFIDRIFWGAVRDFIYWPVIRVYGNVADVWLGVGVILVTWSYCRKTAT